MCMILDILDLRHNPGLKGYSEIAQEWHMQDVVSVKQSHVSVMHNSEFDLKRSFHYEVGSREQQVD